MAASELKLDGIRLNAELDQLARFSDTDPPAVTRVLFTKPDLEARAFVRSLAEQVADEVRVDAAGNLFARWNGSEPKLPAIATGSHIDAIPHSGRYDGTVGVLGAIEAMRALKEGGFEPRRSIELIVFTSEEPTRFGIGCLGSRLLSGTLFAEAAAKLTDAEGQTLEAVRKQAGCVGDLTDVRLTPGCYAAFVELHIEQGPLLEQGNIPIGIVTAIAAPASLRVTLEGEGGHAGAVLMPGRKDALCAAAEIILAVEDAAKRSGSPDTVATTGVCKVHPGAINSIPSRVVLEIDVRDIDGATRDRTVAAIRHAIETSSRGVRAQIEVLNADPPARCGEEVVRAVESACLGVRLASKRMVSRAYHDSLFMARLAPVGMIFIPCRGGVSHRPDEYASPDAIAHGALVLQLTLAMLAA